ncbi:hypothetical protein P0D69_38350 [Paraburkholderia sediminicola]|uniref:hypothetical protein n=1 Tax=Paraburkholderia sediminicola TaxID=458836 RepID=UPI0038B8EED8
MSDARQMRLWIVLAHVRRLRVERRRRILNAARLEMERSAANTAAKREAIARHQARCSEIIAVCTSGNRAAPLWRIALQKHVDERVALVAALSNALSAEQLAEAKAAASSHALQREMRGEEDARARVRRLKAARQKDDDSDD